MDILHTSDIDGLVQDYMIPIAYALEKLQSRTKPSICESIESGPVIARYYDISDFSENNEWRKIRLCNIYNL